MKYVSFADGNMMKRQVLRSMESHREPNGRTYRKILNVRSAA